MSKRVNNAALNQVYGDYQRRCNTKKIKFKISKKLFQKITSQPCHYCGAVPHRVKTWGKHTYVFNGIDKVKPNKGYIRNNIVPCCWTCNIIKSDLPLESFLLAVSSIAKHFLKLKK